MWHHYVYLHRKSSNGEVFYVGKGTIRKRSKSWVCDRAYTKERRSSWWNSVVVKHGLTVEIFASCRTDEAAKELEKELIKNMAEKNSVEGGVLVNMTDGGDGSCGIILSEETLEKRREHARKERTPKWVESMRKSRKNGGNGGVVKKGDKLPKEWKDKIAASKVGSLNHQHGKCGKDSKHSKRVVDMESGVVYDSVSLAAESLGMKMTMLSDGLRGRLNNNSGVVYAKH